MVSVIIPTYNRARSIKESVMSVLKQTYKDIECLVIDDGSCDNTIDILNTIKDSRLKVIELQQNKGPSYARNFGCNKAQGEYIAFNDSDDLWVESKLEKQLLFLNNNPDYSMVYCRFVCEDKAGKTIVPDERFGKKELEDNLVNTLMNFNTIGTPTIIIKKEVWEQIGGFDEKLAALEDYDLAIRIAENNKIGFIDDVLVRVNSTFDSVNSNLFNRGIALLQIGAKYNNSYRLFEKAYDYLIRAGIVGQLDTANMIEQRIARYKSRKSYEERCEEKMCRIKEWIEKIKGKKIIIYGAGAIGKRLILELQNNGVKIVGYIDRASIYINNIEKISTESIPQNVNLILNTVDYKVISTRDIEKTTGIETKHILEL